MSRIAHSPQLGRVQHATTAAFLFLAGMVLLAGAVTFWQCYHLPVLGLAWTLEDGQVTIVESGGPTAGLIEPGDRLLSLNGLRFVPGGDVMRIIHEVRPSQPAQMLVERAGQKVAITVVPAAMDLTLEGHLIDYATGVALWGLGVYVFLKRRTSASARLFLLFDLIAALGLWGNLSLFVDPWYAALRRLALSLLTPYLLTNLVISLPTDRWARRPFLRARLGYYGLSLLLGLGGAVTALLLMDWSYPLYLLILGNQILGFAVAVILVVATHQLLPRGAARDRYRGAVTFSLLGALPFVSTIVLGFWLGWHEFDPRIITIAAFTMPLALAYVILRYQFLGVRVAVREGLTTASMLIATIVTLLLAYVLVNSLLASIKVDKANEIAMIVAALTAVALFEPTRRYIQRRLQYILDRRDVELYEALGSFSRELATLQDRPLLLDSLTLRLETLFPRTRILVVIHDEAGGSYQVARSAGPADPNPNLAFPTTGPLAQQLRQEHAILLRQWTAMLEHLPPEARRQAENLQPEVVIPLTTRAADLLGWIALGAQGGSSSYDEREVALLVSLANQASVAIENVQLWEKTDERLYHQVQELGTLNAIARAVNSTLDLDEVLNRALTRTLAITRFDMGLIALLDETQRLRPTNSDQVPSSILDLLRRMAPDDVEQLFHNLPMFIRDVTTSHLPQNRSLLLDADLHAFCIVPLVSQGNPVGMLGLGMHQEHALVTEDLRLAEAVAHQVGIAIANARLYKEAAEEKQKTEIILQSVGDGVCTTDRDLILLSLNAAAEQLLGWQEHEAIGRPCHQVLQCHNVDEDPLCETACPLVAAMQNRQHEYAHLGTSFMRTLGGRRVPTWSVAGPLIDPVGTVLGGVLAMRDASYEAEMERLQNEFISMISHEVRAPLTNLKAAAQTITRLECKQEDDLQASMARIIAEQCDRLDALVKRVEDAAQFDMDLLDVQTIALYLPPLVRQVVRSFQSREEQRTFEVHATDETSLWVAGDEDKVSTILHNLLDNAAKYSHPQGTIAVQLSPWDQDRVLVSVTDAGPCIPADRRDLIFQRFYRIDNSDARSVYGLGLGLYVARNLVTALDGQIWVEEKDGLGNRFCFTLPRSNEELNPTEGSSKPHGTHTHPDHRR